MSKLISTNENEPEWYIPLREWAVAAEVYQAQTDGFTEYFYTYFPTKAAFNSNDKEIKKVIAMGLAPEDYEILLETEAMKGTMRTGDEKVLWEKRKLLKLKINRIFTRLRNEMYGMPTTPQKEGNFIYSIIFFVILFYCCRWRRKLYYDDIFN